MLVLGAFSLSMNYLFQYIEQTTLLWCKQQNQCTQDLLNKELTGALVKISMSFLKFDTIRGHFHKKYFALTALCNGHVSLNSTAVFSLSYITLLGLIKSPKSTAVTYLSSWVFFFYCVKTTRSL